MTKNFLNSGEKYKKFKCEQKWRDDRKNTKITTAEMEKKVFV